MTVAKNGIKPRTIHLFFEDPASLDKLWNYFHTNNDKTKAVLKEKLKSITEHFKNIAYSRFMVKIKDHCSYLH